MNNMAERKIRLYGDSLLRMKASEVEEFGEHWKPFVDDMFETCINGEGIGLAAPQIGESIRMLVVYISREEEEPFMLAVFNPEILKTEGEGSYEEGCLSIPGIREEVTRPEKIKLRFRNYLGETQELEADGLLARVLQHEIDHLHGVLFVDHLSPVKRALIKGKLKKITEGELVE